MEKVWVLRSDLVKCHLNVFVLRLTPKVSIGIFIDSEVLEASHKLSDVIVAIRISMPINVKLN